MKLIFASLLATLALSFSYESAAATGADPKCTAERCPACCKDNCKDCSECKAK